MMGLWCGLLIPVTWLCLLGACALWTSAKSQRHLYPTRPEPSNDASPPLNALGQAFWMANQCSSQAYRAPPSCHGVGLHGYSGQTSLIRTPGRF